MPDIVLLTADLAVLHQVEVALTALGPTLSLRHYVDAAAALTALLPAAVPRSDVAALLVDVILPDGDGALLVDALRAEGYNAPLILMHDTHNFALLRLAEAARHAPVAIIAKTSPLPMLIAALRRVLGGTALVDAPSATLAPGTPVVDEPAPPVKLRLDRLSIREREVLALFAQGNSGKVVARKLGTEVKTVFNQCRSIFEKTGVRPMRQLLLLLANIEKDSIT
jgi:DNA-binding NarL/FixJ family response regulator